MKNKGFTLIELMIVVAIVGIVLAIVLGFLVPGCGGGMASAQEEANHFIQRNNINANADCVDFDTDGDGYVSCPFIYTDGSIKGMECSYWGNGCREPKASMGW